MYNSDFIPIKPISINSCFQGRRFRTSEFKAWQEAVHYKLPPLQEFHKYPEDIHMRIYIYLRNYLELKSKFALGIALAMVALLTFAITSNPLLLGFLGIYGNMGLFSIIPMFFAMIALGILAWMSSK